MTQSAGKWSLSGVEIGGMKKCIAGLTGIVMLLGATAVSRAEDRGFVGVNFIQLEQYNRFFPGADDYIDTGELQVRFGGNINRYIASELRIGTTVIPEKDAGLEFTNDYHVGGVLRFQRPMAGLTPYVGLMYTFIRESLGDASADAREFGANVGLDVNVGQRLGVNLEFMMMSGDPTSDLDRKGPSAGLFWKF